MVELTYKNYVLDIPNTVYYPSDDTYLLLNYLLEDIKRKHQDCLEIGAGSGLLSLSVYNNFNNLMLVDINKHVIDYLFDIKKKYDLKKLNILQSNLFEKINKKFDVIIFNPPYVPSSEFEDLATDGGLEGSEIINLFLDNLYDFLKTNGVCYLLISSLNNKSKIFNKIKKNNLDYEVLGSKRIFFEELIILKIRKISG